jgi:hypothetical protein
MVVEEEKQRERDRELATARPNFRHGRAVFDGSLAEPAMPLLHCRLQYCPT